jgi:pimeloyl-ACP methyl ester carboxylesterase/DNA-binding SARP family transcriptional activator
MASAPAPELEIRLFGGLQVFRRGEMLSLPQSRKTRALLAYLIVKAAPQRRDTLCELFWDTPDDPRASLRWSLSKLRALVNDRETVRLTADRERVAFAAQGAVIDFARVQEACVSGLAHLSRAELLGLCNACSGALLAGLDLPDQPAYETWRIGQQEKARRLYARAIDELLARPDTDMTERTALLQGRVEIEPDNQTAHLQLIGHLAATGSVAKALAQATASRRMLVELGGLDERELSRALRGLISPAPLAPSAPAVALTLRQDIRFCTSGDGVRIAYATVGSGPPLVKTANWLNHLEFDWESPIWRPIFDAFASDHTFVRYDSRGNGLSDWNVEHLTLDAFVGDLKAVVDAARIERFPLLAMSQGCAFAIEFAARYPERVSSLILYGGYARGWRTSGNAELAAQMNALITLTRTGWGRDNPAYRQVFTSLFIPGATPQQMDWLNELQRMTTSPENAARLMLALGDIDVSRRLPQITQPTLVLHRRNDARVAYANGRELATGIPGAKFVTLEGENHLLLEQEPAWPTFLAEVRAFLAE